MRPLKWLVFAPSLLLSATSSPADDLHVSGSATIELRYFGEEREEKSDEIIGFFDQYQFLRNKDASGPFELGLSALQLDVLGAALNPSIRTTTAGGGRGPSPIGSAAFEPICSFQTPTAPRARSAFKAVSACGEASMGPFRWRSSPKRKTGRRSSDWSGCAATRSTEKSAR